MKVEHGRDILPRHALAFLPKGVESCLVKEFIEQRQVFIVAGLPEELKLHLVFVAQLLGKGKKVVLRTGRLFSGDKYTGRWHGMRIRGNYYENQIISDMKVTNKTERELKTLDLDGYKIHYVDIGEGEPVVLVHGGISDYRIWEAQLEAFSAEHRVIAISRRFAYPNEQTIRDSEECAAAAHARDLIGFLEKLGLGPVHLIGHSFGGFISIMAALERPELLKSLTLLEPPASSVVAGVPEAHRLWTEFVHQVMVPAGKAFGEGKDEEAVACFIGGVMGDPSYYETAPRQDRNMWLANTPELKVVVSGADLFPQLSCSDFEGLAVPTLLIKGEQSPGFIRLISDQLHRCMPNSTLKELPNASHGLQHQNPAGFNEMVLGFIEEY